ncbi:MAG: hypothetical protein ACT4NY_12000 [Pseudonocardiales bacterium]
MSTRDRVTLLQQLMTERRWTRNDTLKRLAVRAPSVGADDFALSLRQLDRMLAGQVETLPHASTCRVLEAEFERRIEDLLSFVDQPSSAARRTSAPATRPYDLSSGHEDADLPTLMVAATDSAEFALWQGVDQLCVDTLYLRLSRLAHDYVHAEMMPVVRAVHELRAETIELLPRAGTFGRELYLVAGICSAVLAHAAGNLGHLHESPWHVNAALRFAELSRCPVLAAWALGVQALQLEWSGYPDRSLDTLTRASTYLDREPESPGTTGVWLAAIEARAHARRGDIHATRRALDQVAFHRDQSAIHTTGEYDMDSIGGILIFGEPKQHYYAATALRRVGQMPAARTHALAAIDGYEHGPQQLRSYGDDTLARLDLAISYAADDRPDLDAAADTLAQVCALPTALLLPTLGGHLDDLAAAASAPPVRSARQAIYLRATAKEIAACCRPRPAEVSA